MAAAETGFVPNEVLVKFRPNSEALAQMYHNAIGAKKVGEVSQLGWQRISLPARTSVSNALTYYRRLGAVEAVDRNGYYGAHASVNDPMANQQYSIPRMTVNLGWDLTTGDDKVLIAVVDSGVDYNHQDLSGKVTKGHDWTQNDDDPMDVAQHGTHVAGIAAAKTNNGVGVAGVGYNASILAIRVLGDDNTGQWDWIANGIVEAADKKADIINLSLGGYFDSAVVRDAVDYAWGKGCVIIASTGNDNITEKSYPAAYEKVIAVASTDAADQRSSFSNYGADWADVAAPGSSILSTIPGSKYEFFDGTSMASPNVSGVAALVLAYGGKGVMTNAEVREAIESTTVNVGTFVKYGRVNAFAAVTAAVPPVVERRGPVSATMFDGSAASGTAENLWTNDTLRYNVDSRYVDQLGGVAGAEVAFTHNMTASQYLNGKITVRGSGVMGSTATIYMKRTNGTYLLLKSFPVSGSLISTTVSLPNTLTPYLTNKRLTFVARCVLPKRYGNKVFRYALDSAILETRSSSRVQP